MAKFKLQFLDFINSNDFIRVGTDINNSVIEIFTESDEKSCHIVLDKSTAIKLAKTLRTEINKITESEGENGKTN